MVEPIYKMQKLTAADDALLFATRKLPLGF